MSDFKTFLNFLINGKGDIDFGILNRERIGNRIQIVKEHKVRDLDIELVWTYMSQKDRDLLTFVYGYTRMYPDKKINTNTRQLCQAITPNKYEEITDKYCTETLKGVQDKFSNMFETLSSRNDETMRNAWALFEFATNRTLNYTIIETCVKILYGIHNVLTMSGIYNEFPTFRGHGLLAVYIASNGLEYTMAIINSPERVRGFIEYRIYDTEYCRNLLKKLTTRY